MVVSFIIGCISYSIGAMLMFEAMEVNKKTDQKDRAFAICAGAVWPGVLIGVGVIYLIEKLKERNQ